MVTLASKVVKCCDYLKAKHIEIMICENKKSNILHNGKINYCLFVYFLGLAVLVLILILLVNGYSFILNWSFWFKKRDG